MQKRRVVVCVRPACWQKGPFPAYCMAFNSGGAGVCPLTCLLTLRFRWQTDSPEMPWRYINPSSRPRSNMLWHSPVRRLEPSRTIPALTQEEDPRSERSSCAGTLLVFFFSFFHSGHHVNFSDIGLTHRRRRRSRRRRYSRVVQFQSIQRSPFEIPASFKRHKVGQKTSTGD